LDDALPRFSLETLSFSLGARSLESHGDHNLYARYDEPVRAQFRNGYGECAVGAAEPSPRFPRKGHFFGKLF
jgi:hypothetical protein